MIFWWLFSCLMPSIRKILDSGQGKADWWTHIRLDRPHFLYDLIDNQLAAPGFRQFSSDIATKKNLNRYVQGVRGFRLICSDEHDTQWDSAEPLRFNIKRLMKYQSSWFFFPPGLFTFFCLTTRPADILLNINRLSSNGLMLDIPCMIIRYYKNGL